MKLSSNVNQEKQIKLFSHLLERAKEGKIDTIGICWEDEDLGKGGYLDWYDLPAETLRKMMVESANLLQKVHSE